MSIIKHELHRLYLCGLLRAVGRVTSLIWRCKLSERSRNGAGHFGWRRARTFGDAKWMNLDVLVQMFFCNAILDDIATCYVHLATEKSYLLYLRQFLVYWLVIMVLKSRRSSIATMRLNWTEANAKERRSSGTFTRTTTIKSDDQQTAKKTCLQITNGWEWRSGPWKCERVVFWYWAG